MRQAEVNVAALRDQVLHQTPPVYTFAVCLIHQMFIHQAHESRPYWNNTNGTTCCECTAKRVNDRRSLMHKHRMLLYTRTSNIPSPKKEYCKNSLKRIATKHCTRHEFNSLTTKWWIHSISHASHNLKYKIKSMAICFIPTAYR